MKIKRFLELFDTDDIKSRHEIEYLSGNFKNLGRQKVERDFQHEDIGNLIRKMIDWNYPFFKAFEDAVKEDSAEINFNEFSAYISKGDDEYWSFVIHSKEYTTVIGIKVNKVNNYDIYIYLDKFDAMDDESLSPGFEMDGISYNELIEKINSIFIPFIKEAGFEKILDYNKEGSNLNN
jgi:hypothetical protein